MTCYLYVASGCAIDKHLFMSPKQVFEVLSYICDRQIVGKLLRTAALAYW